MTFEDFRHTPTYLLVFLLQFLWQPYTDLVDSIPEYCMIGSAIWRATVPLICFDVVEWHFPDRVLRQFGMAQLVPPPCDTERRLHTIDRRGRAGMDWSLEHATHVHRWIARYEYIVAGHPSSAPMSYTDPYMVWFRSVTRLLIGNPSTQTTQGYQPDAAAFQHLVCHMLQVTN